MKAALVNLVFNETTLLLAHIIKNLRENPFQGVVGYYSSVFSGSLNSFITIIANIEGGAIEVT